ncbi:MAG: hypothetical protein D8M55_11215 [Chloroflexi bacterium]|nr:hypothetical protein [Chloroflexota bacterium]
MVVIARRVFFPTKQSPHQVRDCFAALAMTGTRKEARLKHIAILLLCLCITACSNATLTPGATVAFTPTVTITVIPTPTNTPTRTPSSTATPLSELTAADVGLPWDTNTSAVVKHLPCYVNTDTRFHAGDGFYFTGVQNGEIIYVVAPITGRVVYAAYTNDFVGQNVIVETPYVFNGERVFYQIVHFNNLLVSEGNWLVRGDKIGELVRGGIIHGDPRGTLLLDFGVFHTNRKWHTIDASDSNDMPQYIPVSTLVADDLAKLSNLTELPICEGNPK